LAAPIGVSQGFWPARPCTHAPHRLYTIKRKPKHSYPPTQKTRAVDDPTDERASREHRCECIDDCRTDGGVRQPGTHTGHSKQRGVRRASSEAPPPSSSYGEPYTQTVADWYFPRSTKWDVHTCARHGDATRRSCAS
jgi:hypothetical protein